MELQQCYGLGSDFRGGSGAVSQILPLTVTSGNWAIAKSLLTHCMRFTIDWASKERSFQRYLEPKFGNSGFPYLLYIC